MTKCGHMVRENVQRIDLQFFHFKIEVQLFANLSRSLAHPALPHARSRTRCSEPTTSTAGC